MLRANTSKARVCGRGCSPLASP